MAGLMAGLPSGWAGGVYADDSPETKAMRFGMIEELVATALDDIPPELGDYMDNVAVFVEDQPASGVSRSLRGDPAHQARRRLRRMVMPTGSPCTAADLRDVHDRGRGRAPGAGDRRARGGAPLRHRRRAPPSWLGLSGTSPSPRWAPTVRHRGRGHGVLVEHDCNLEDTSMTCSAATSP